MTQPTPPTAPAGDSGGGGALETLKKKVGPLPIWAWLGLTVGILLFFRSKSNAAASDDSDASSSVDPTTNPDQVPQYINQTYIQNQPPSTPDDPTNPVSPPGQVHSLPVDGGTYQHGPATPTKGEVPISATAQAMAKKDAAIAALKKANASETKTIASLKATQARLNKTITTLKK